MRGAAFQAAMPAFERACLVSPGMTRRLKACSTLILAATLTAHAAEPGYVDPATCRPCHSRIVESYRQTGMGRSFGKAGTLPALPEFYHQPSGRYYSRSEEHTSELQSPCNLVCRLLLEKKKQSKQLLLSRV